mmetsp:Transcript_27411/g.69929  ORF Transcript_27411/g.69929 Transcript_27411/m.69929 type:complete len:139 (+) Transcript_27411:286-702(+)
MPQESGCAGAAVHRALEAALKEGWRQRALVSLTLSQLPQQPAGGAAGGAEGVAEGVAEGGADDGAGAARPEEEGYPELASRVSEGGRERECIVCLDAPRDHVLVPCGHACVCDECCRAIGLCPICRAPVERAVRLYES